jgi:hypothetical protein
VVIYNWLEITAGFGTQTAAIAVGGCITTWTGNIIVSSYDGTSWTS